MTELGPIGLGTFPFSNVFGHISAEEADAVVHTFLDRGGSYIQTAPYYDGVDDLMGGILSRIDRDRFLIGTLCVKDRQSKVSGSRDAVFSQCDDSLRRLRLDHIDVYLTSTPEGADVPFAETMGAMEELKSQGKVREIGVCNVSLSQLREYNVSNAVRFVQNRFSLLDQEADRDVREYCVAAGIGLIPYNVIEWGLLTSKILESFDLRDGDVRSHVLPVFEPDKIGAIRNWVLSRLMPIAERRDTTIERLAVAWVIAQPGVTVCPVGATRTGQIDSTMRARDLLGDRELISELNDAYSAFELWVRETHDTTVNLFLRNSYGLW